MLDSCRYLVGLAGLFAIFVCSERSLADSTPTTRPFAPHFEVAVPHEVGHHRIHFIDQIDGQPIEMMTVFSVSEKIAATKGKVPLLIFLCGVGERGDNGDGIFLNGPSGEMERNPSLKKDLPVLSLSPQCPADRRWDDAVMVKAVVDCIETAKKNPWVDPSRIYITGLSMGGKGTWMVAQAAPKLFAAIAPISAMAVDPDRAAVLFRNTPIWIVVGGDDDGFRQGSEQMATALKNAGGDVLLTELPGVGHWAWSKTYCRMEFYQWLVSCQRGNTSKFLRPKPDVLELALNSPPTDFQQRMERDFHQFAQYWSMNNCGDFAQPGFRGDANGKQNIFVSHPLAPDISCQMQTTWTIPADKPAHLNLVVGHNPQGAWKLTIRANGRTVLDQMVSKETSDNGWLTKSIDLSAWAGNDVNLVVLSSAKDWANCEAYWAKLSVDY
jgi:predicted esterase